MRIGLDSLVKFKFKLCNENSNCFDFARANSIKNSVATETLSD